MKTLEKLKDVKVLSKTEQKEIHGGNDPSDCIWNEEAQCYEYCTCG